MKDPTLEICAKAMTFPEVEQGMSCNQSTFKATKTKFLFIGPGPKRQGYKAMFKLNKSIPQAQELAAKEPDRYQVGSSYITVRFTAENPIPRNIWESWLSESYELSCR